MPYLNADRVTELNVVSSSLMPPACAVTVPPWFGSAVMRGTYRFARVEERREGPLVHCDRVVERLVDGVRARGERAELRLVGRAHEAALLAGEQLPDHLAFGRVAPLAAGCLDLGGDGLAKLVHGCGSLLELLDVLGTVDQALVLGVETVVPLAVLGSDLVGRGQDGALLGEDVGGPLEQIA
jgi:hypothetical protein